MLTTRGAVRVLGLVLPVALIAAGCSGDDGAEVRELEGSGSASASGSASGSASASGSGSASGSASASGSGSGSASASGVGSEGASGTLGGYEPVSDVSSHAQVTADVCDIKDLLPKDAEIDYDAVAAVYTDGANSESGDGMRTLQGFATAERDEPLWNSYVERFGSTWLDDFVTAAIDGSGPFEGEVDLVRRQGIEKGVQNQVMVAWALHEMDAARVDIEAGELDPASGAPHKVDEVWAFYHGAEPGCAPYGTADSRGADFATGDVTNRLALEATEGMRDAAVEGDLEAFDAAYDEFLRAIAVTYTQATLKYSQTMAAAVEAGDDAGARIQQAEGWAFFRVIEPLVADVDAGAADTVAGVLDLANEPAADGGETVRAAMEGVYGGLGISADQLGEFQG